MRLDPVFEDPRSREPGWSSHGAVPPPRRGIPPGIWGPAVGVACGAWLAGLFLQNEPVEGAVLRYVAVCAQHPLRVGLATLCGTLALRPRAPVRASSRRKTGAEAGKMPTHSL